MIRVYGHGRGTSSFVQVTKGVARAARANGRLAGVFHIDDPERYEYLELPPGLDAEVATHCGAPLGALTSHRYGNHREHWLLLAPNSEGIPPKLVELLTKGKPSPQADGTQREHALSGLLAPSRWARDVLMTIFEHLPVVLAPHGIDPELYYVDDDARFQQALADQYRQENFWVLHVTSSLLERKGTRQLLAAWKRAKNGRLLPKQAQLVVLAHPMAVTSHLWCCEELGMDAAAYRVAVRPAMGLSDVGFARLLAGVHLVCQPSRAEGFGLVPLEALAAGTPVAITGCTGHGAFALMEAPGGCLKPRAGVTLVDHEASAASDDYPGATAPEVTEDAVLWALSRAYSDWWTNHDAARAAARDLRKEWAWENVMGPALRGIDVAS